MFGHQVKHLTHRVQKALLSLLRQAIHQIQTDVVKPALARELNRRLGLFERVNAADACKLVVIR